MNEFLVVTFNLIVWNPIEIFREGRKDAQKKSLKKFDLFQTSLDPPTLRWKNYWNMLDSAAKR